jgi:hypothetical protein
VLPDSSFHLRKVLRRCVGPFHPCTVHLPMRSSNALEVDRILWWPSLATPPEAALSQSASKRDGEGSWLVSFGTSRDRTPRLGHFVPLRTAFEAECRGHRGVRSRARSHQHRGILLCNDDHRPQRQADCRQSYHAVRAFCIPRQALPARAQVTRTAASCAERRILTVDREGSRRPRPAPTRLQESIRPGPLHAEPGPTPGLSQLPSRGTGPAERSGDFAGPS